MRSYSPVSTACEKSAAMVRISTGARTAALSSAATAAKRSALREISTTFEPCRASALAYALPMPCGRQWRPGMNAEENE
jgi:hypothetical protein